MRREPTPGGKAVDGVDLALHRLGAVDLLAVGEVRGGLVPAALVAEHEREIGGHPQRSRLRSRASRIAHSQKQGQQFPLRAGLVPGERQHVGAVIPVLQQEVRLDGLVEHRVARPEVLARLVEATGHREDAGEAHAEPRVEHRVVAVSRPELARGGRSPHR